MSGPIVQSRRKLPEVDIPTDPPDSPISRSAERRLLLGILLLAIALRIWLATGQEMTRQDAGTLGRAIVDYRSASDVLELARQVDVHPPAYYFGLCGAVRVAGLDVARMKLIHVGIGMLSLILIYAWVRCAAGARAALWAAFLTAASGYHLLWSVNMRMYMLNAALLTTAAMFAWRYWTSRPTWTSLVGYALSVAAALHTHYYALFGWLALLAWTARRSVRRSPERRGWWCAQAGIALAFLPWFLFGFMHQYGAGRTATVDGGIATLWREIAFAPFRFFFFGLRQQSPWLAALLSAAIGGLYLAGIRDSARGKPLKEGAPAGAPSPILHFSCLAVVPIAVAAAYSMVRSPIFGLHYLNVSYPAACALAACGLARIPRLAAVGFACLYLAANGLTLGPMRALGNEGYRRSFDLFQREGSLEDAVVFNCFTHSGEGFLFYAKAGNYPFGRLAFFSLIEDSNYPDVRFLTRWHDWGSPDRAAVGAGDRMSELLATHRRVWFINMSHAAGAFPEFEELLIRRFHPRIEDLGETRVFLMHPEAR